MFFRLFATIFPFPWPHMVVAGLKLFGLLNVNSLPIKVSGRVCAAPSHNQPNIDDFYDF